MKLSKEIISTICNALEDCVFLEDNGDFSIDTQALEHYLNGLELVYDPRDTNQSTLVEQPDYREVSDPWSAVKLGDD
jgi:hypothetical protein